MNIDTNVIEKSQKIIDAFIDYLYGHKFNSKFIKSILDEISSFAVNADDLDEMLDDYNALYKKFDVKDLEEYLLNAMIVSHLYGQYSLDNQSVSNNSNQRYYSKEPVITAEDLLAAFDKSPEDAIEYLKSKGIEVSSSWEKTLELLKAKAFTVTGLIRLDILNDLKIEIEKALAEQKSSKDFAKEVKEKMLKAGWNDPATTSLSRLQLIYDTNVQSAFMDGRWNKVIDMADSRPYIQMLSTIDPKTTKECKFLHLKVFRFDDTKLHYFMPMGHFRCRRNYVTMTEKEFERTGLKVTNGDTVMLHKNKKGFTKKPFEKFSVDMSKYPQELLNVYDGD